MIPLQYVIIQIILKWIFVVGAVHNIQALILEKQLMYIVNQHCSIPNFNELNDIHDSGGTVNTSMSVYLGQPVSMEPVKVLCILTTPPWNLHA